MWEQSLLLGLVTVLVAAAGGSSVFAMSYCSSSFRFDQLCPDPRFGSRESGGGSGGGGGGSMSSNSGNHLSTDTYIYLNTDNYNYHMRGRGGGGSYSSSSYGGRSYTSSMSVKDSNTTSCDFHRNGVETAVVTAIHVTENPWNFRHANQCNHIVKFSYDLFEGGGGIVGSGLSSSGSAKQSVCQNEIGFRRQGSQDVDHNDPGKEKSKREEQGDQIQNDGLHGHHNEDISRKMNVYFWHNFTLYPHSAEYVDTITNYHWSMEDISCVKEKRSGQYVQMVVVVSKSGRCEIVVQQYKVDEKRSPWGCSGAGYPIPYPIQFCGTYECSQSSGILTSLKLLSRRDSDCLNSTDQQKPLWGNQGSSPRSTSGGGSPDKFPPSSSHRNSQSSGGGGHQYETGEGTHTYSDYDEESEGGTCVGGPPCVTRITDTTTSTNSGGDGPDDEEEEEQKPMDWMEAMFLIAFPTGGVLFIIIVLNILRSKSAREICRGYSYPRPEDHQNNFHYTFHNSNSIDKHALPM